MIDWKRFEELEKKYSKVCQENLKLKNNTKRYDKLPQAVVNSISGDGLYIKRMKSGKGGIIYLKNTIIKKGHCDICGKRRKTTAHHIIPKRVKSINKELRQVRVRVCRECENSIHPENGYDKNHILEIQYRNQMKLQKSLNKKAEDILRPFRELLDSRINDIIRSGKSLHFELRDTPKKIQPAKNKCTARIYELRWLRGNFSRIINKSLGTFK